MDRISRMCRIASPMTNVHEQAQHYKQTKFDDRKVNIQIDDDDDDDDDDGPLEEEEQTSIIFRLFSNHLD